MRIYVAGPMRGYPQFNFPAFHEATALLRSQGHEVFNPAEQDIERHGADFATNNPTGDERQAAQKGFSLRQALGDDLAWICSTADAIAMLPGWMGSKGARAELATAEALGLQVLYLREKIGCGCTRRPGVDAPCGMPDRYGWSCCGNTSLQAANDAAGLA